MRTGILFLVIVTLSIASVAQSQTTENKTLSINGFTQWITGHDTGTVLLLPASGVNGLTKLNGKTIAHLRCKVIKYGEISFPINPTTPANTEALAVDLGRSRFIKVKYRANHEVILQLRQTGIHGGTHNHVILPASNKFITQKIYFSSFKGGLKPLDLKDVAKFNFAFLGNNPMDGFADLIVKSFKIDRYRP